MKPALDAVNMNTLVDDIAVFAVRQIGEEQTLGRLGLSGTDATATEALYERLGKEIDQGAEVMVRVKSRPGIKFVLTREAMEAGLGLDSPQMPKCRISPRGRCRKRLQSLTASHCDA